jgi:NUDIX domain
MVTGVTGRSVLPPEQYVASLARKRMAATAFFRDDQGRVLLVNPVYKEPWDLPGGAVEAEESPHAACRREVAEELGLDRPGSRSSTETRSRAGDAAAGATRGIVPRRGGGGRGRGAGKRQPGRLTVTPQDSAGAGIALSIRAMRRATGSPNGRQFPRANKRHGDKAIATVRPA